MQTKKTEMRTNKGRNEMEYKYKTKIMTDRWWLYVTIETNEEIIRMNPELYRVGKTGTEQNNKIEVHNRDNVIILIQYISNKMKWYTCSEHSDELANRVCFTKIDF